MSDSSPETLQATVEVDGAHKSDAARPPERNTETPVPNSGSGPVIPYARFQQVVGERNRLKGDLEALQAEQRTVGEKAGALEQDLQSARMEALRLRAVVGAGLPLEFAERLQGTTAEELAEDAARLAGFLKPAGGPGVPPPAAGAKPGKIDVLALTPEEIRKKREELLRQARR